MSDSGLITNSSASTGRFDKNRHKEKSPKMKYPCDFCGKYGCFKRDHSPDELLPSHCISTDSCQESSSKGSDNSSCTNLRSNSRGDRVYRLYKKTVRFSVSTTTGPSSLSSNILCSSSSSTNLPTVELGSLLDDGALYAESVTVELCLSGAFIEMTTYPKLEPISESIVRYTH